MRKVKVDRFVLESLLTVVVGAEGGDGSDPRHLLL